MNVTHTEGRKFGLEGRPPSVLDQQSNTKDREAKAANAEPAPNSDNDSDGLIETRLHSSGEDIEQAIMGSEVELNDRNSIIKSTDINNKEQIDPILMQEQYQEQHTIEESTINNTISEEEPVNTIETKELTLSEHCKELIFDNFEPRPGLPRLNHGGSSHP